MGKYMNMAKATRLAAREEKKKEKKVSSDRVSKKSKQSEKPDSHLTAALEQALDDHLVEVGAAAPPAAPQEDQGPVTEQSSSESSDESESEESEDEEAPEATDAPLAFVIDTVRTKIDPATLPQEAQPTPKPPKPKRPSQMPAQEENRNTRRRLKLIERQREKIIKQIQMAGELQEGSPEFTAAVDSATAEWSARRDEQTALREKKKKKRKESAAWRQKKKKEVLAAAIGGDETARLLVSGKGAKAKGIKRKGPRGRKN